MILTHEGPERHVSLPARLCFTNLVRRVLTKAEEGVQRILKASPLSILTHFYLALKSIEYYLRNQMYEVRDIKGQEVGDLVGKLARFIH